MRPTDHHLPSNAPASDAQGSDASPGFGRTRRRVLAGASVLILSLGAAAACSGADDDPEAPGDTSTTQTTTDGTDGSGTSGDGADTDGPGGSDTGNTGGSVDGPAASPGSASTTEPMSGAPPGDPQRDTGDQPGPTQP